MPRAQSSQSHSQAQASKLRKAKTPYASTSGENRRKAAEWTAEMDDTVIEHVMARSEIWIKFDWKALIEESMPDMRVEQIQRRWERVIKDKILGNPPPSGSSMKRRTTKASSSGVTQQSKKQQEGKKNGSKAEDVDENEWEDERG